MKKVITLLLVFVMVLGLAACGGDKDKKDEKVLKIGVIQLVKHDALDRAYEGFVDGLKEQGYIDGENIEIDYQVAAGAVAAPCDKSSLKGTTNIRLYRYKCKTKFIVMKK